MYAVILVYHGHMYGLGFADLDTQRRNRQLSVFFVFVILHFTALQDYFTQFEHGQSGWSSLGELLNHPKTYLTCGTTRTRTYKSEGISDSELALLGSQPSDGGKST